MHAIISLTVPESKRLIAKGVAKDERVRRAIEEGIVIVTSGTTNGYVVEEITGQKIDREKFVTGHTLPSNYKGTPLTFELPELVIQKGARTNLKLAEAIEMLKAGDVVIKGANALNYERRQCAVLIGHPEGGTVGKLIGTIVARRVTFLHPVGLEKTVTSDLNDLAQKLMKNFPAQGPSLWVLPGEVFTEIEALHVLSGVECIHIASGGIGGAEGAVWLAIFGDKTKIDHAMNIVDSIRGEPSFP